MLTPYLGMWLRGHAFQLAAQSDGSAVHQAAALRRAEDEGARLLEEAAEWETQADALQRNLRAADADLVAERAAATGAIPLPGWR